MFSHITGKMDGLVSLDVHLKSMFGSKIEMLTPANGQTRLLRFSDIFGFHAITVLWPWL